MECILIGGAGVICDFDSCLVVSGIVVDVEIRAFVEAIAVRSPRGS